MTPRTKSFSYFCKENTCCLYKKPNKKSKFLLARGFISELSEHPLVFGYTRVVYTKTA